MLAIVPIERGSVNPLGRAHGTERCCYSPRLVLSADLRFEGFTQSDWTRVLSLFRPRATSGGERDPDRPQGGLVAVHGDGRLRKLLHSQAGRLRLDDCAADWPMSPMELARRHHASWALVLESGALEDIMESFAARVRRSDDFTAQSVLFASLVRDQMHAGQIQFFPSRLAGLPMPTANMINRTIDAVCPAKHAIVIGLFDAGELWTCLVLRRAESGTFDWILGPDEVRRDMGLLAGDFRRDYRHLARTIEHKAGKVSLGVFSEVRTFRALSVDPTPGAWARAVAIRDVILSPVPAALAVPLGLDAGRAAFSLLRSAVERAQGLSMVSPAMGVLKDALTGVAAAASGLSGAGEEGDFDPLEILRRLLARDR